MDNTYLNYKEAKAFVRKLKLKDEQEYHNWFDKNQPDFPPRHPDIYYSKIIDNKNLNVKG